MTVHALGGPPPCRKGEAEGTVVEVLPSRGPEGSFMRKDEVGNWLGLVQLVYMLYIRFWIAYPLMKITPQVIMASSSAKRIARTLSCK